MEEGLRTAADCSPGAGGPRTEADSKPGAGRRGWLPGEGGGSCCTGCTRRGAECRAGTAAASWAGLGRAAALGLRHTG